MLPCMHLCRVIASALHKDALFQAVAQEEYGRPWSVCIGFDGRRMDWKKQAPAAVICPWESEGGRSGREYSVTLTLVVLDERVDELDGIRLLHGLSVLDERAWPQAWAAVQDVLPGLVPQASLTEPALAVSQDNAPLLLLHGGLNVELNLPVGQRRL